MGKRVCIPVDTVVIVIVVGLHKPGPDQTVIGWIGLLSGQYASYGKQVKAGTEMPAEEVGSAGAINGEGLRVVYENDHFDTKRDVVGFNELVFVPQVAGLPKQRAPMSSWTCR